MSDKLPEGKTCQDCKHYQPRCMWVMGANPEKDRCDWNPSEFVEQLLQEKD